MFAHCKQLAPPLSCNLHVVRLLSRERSALPLDKERELKFYCDHSYANTRTYFSGREVSATRDREQKLGEIDSFTYLHI